MTVAELIEQLKALPQDRLVVLSSDEEGNSHRPINGADGDDAFWLAKERELVQEEYAGGEPCVVIW